MKDSKSNCSVLVKPGFMRQFTVKDVSVEGVYSNRDSGNDGRKASEYAGLGGVGVDDVGTLGSHEPNQDDEGSQVVERFHRPAEAVDLADAIWTTLGVEIRGRTIF